MPGKGSRARRVEATRRAFADVYRLRGAEMPAPPFGNERQDRIYTQQYAKYRRSYWHVERMHAELAEVYGYTPTPRLRHGEREMRHTAEEVRERAAEDMAAHVSADMLLAYADLLEQMESADADLPEGVWPDELMIRDTALHDDMGGQGQRIYTTAGAGYPKVKYVRANAATSADAEDAARWRYLLRNRFVLGNGTCLIDAHCTAQDAELLDAIDEARAEEAECGLPWL